jgi:hypothetical protein
LRSVTLLATDIGRWLGQHVVAPTLTLRLRQSGLCEAGRAGAGGVGAPANTAIATLLLLAIALGSDAKKALRQASALHRLAFTAGYRNYIGPAGAVSLPFDPTPMQAYSFGETLESIINAHRLGHSLDDIQRAQVDQATRLSGIRFGTTGGSVFAQIERTSLAPNEDGAILLDAFTFTAAPDRRVADDAIYLQRLVFFDASILARVAKALGPLPIASSGGGEPVTDALPDDPADEELLPIAASPETQVEPVPATFH